MGHFTTKGKRYRDGVILPSFASIDLMVGSAGSFISQPAPASLPGPDGAMLSFLYWDTGRRITNKRTVQWTFNHPDNWAEWNAVAWYGLPDGNGGEPVVTVDAHWVGVGPIDPTPIDAAGSTFVNGPGGVLAYPWSGNDHKVRTEWGAATLHAKDHLQKSAGDPVLDFSSWTQLFYGGDDTSFFSENDNDITTPVTTVTGISSTTSPFITAAKGSGGLIMAGYVPPGKPDVAIPADIFEKLLYLLRDPSVYIKFKDKGDPSPEDIIRLKLISESLDLVRGVKTTDGDAFEGLLAAAKKMSSAELKRTITATRSTLARGQAALKSIESLAGKQKSK